jgi:hypothetical protein
MMQSHCRGPEQEGRATQPNCQQQCCWNALAFKLMALVFFLKMASEWGFVRNALENEGFAG